MNSLLNKMTEHSQNTAHSAFANRLKTCASKVGSMNALAKKAQISASTLSFYTKGGEPNRLKLLQIANAAGVDSGWLCDGAPRKKQENSADASFRPSAPERVTESLRKLASRFGGAAGLAQISSLPEARVEDLIEGTDPTATELDKLAEASQLPINALFYPLDVPGETIEPADPTSQPKIGNDPFEFTVPLVLGLNRDNKGSWGLLFEKARARIPSHWIRDGLKYANIQTLALMKVIGTEMYPMLKDGEIVIVDIGDKRPTQGPRLVRIGGGLTFCDVLINRGDEIECRYAITPSGQPNPNRWPLDRLGKDVEIMGRVINVIRNPVN